MKRVLRTVTAFVAATATIFTLASPSSAASAATSTRAVGDAASPASSRATPAGTAAAAAVELNGGKFNGNYVNIRSKPSTSGGTIYGQGQKGQGFCFNDFIYNGSWLYGKKGGTHSGYVLEKYITYQPNSPCTIT